MSSAEWAVRRVEHSHYRLLSSTSDDLYQTQSLTSPVLHVRRKLLSVQCPSALNFLSLKEVVDNLRAVKILELIK